VAEAVHRQVRQVVVLGVPADQSAELPKFERARTPTNALLVARGTVASQQLPLRATRVALRCRTSGGCCFEPMRCQGQARCAVYVRRWCARAW
jgi:hypothetical protein